MNVRLLCGFIVPETENLGSKTHRKQSLVGIF